jgi:hypothetical protein
MLDSEDLIKQKNVKIETNKKLTDNCGVEREFDLYWENKSSTRTKSSFCYKNWLPIWCKN